MKYARRDFFRKLIKPFKKFYLHPPYYKDKADFSFCLKCSEKPCVSACENEIITINDGIPILKFNSGGCTFCDECAKVCGKVLKVENKREKINGEVTIDPVSCLAYNESVCFSCQDVCEYDAISFEGMFNPTINEKCVSCGECISVCPTKAIEVKPMEDYE